MDSVTELRPVHDPSRGEHHVLVQAPVAPVDADGVMASQLGTAAFGLLTIVAWWFRDALEQRGDAWWLWTCLTGFLIGVAIVAFTRRRRARTVSAATGQSNKALSTVTESQTGSGR